MEINSMVESSLFHIGIEGMASTFSVGILSDNDGKILSATRSAPISLHTIPNDILIIRINDLIKKLIKIAHLDTTIYKDTSVCIGLTGTTFSYDREIDLQENIFGEIKPKFKNVICTGDAEISFISSAKCREGSIVTCLLGSTVLLVGNKDDIFSFTRVGGWGPIFGDDGSAFYMGREAFRALSNSYDLKEPISKLWTEIDNWLSNPKPYFDSWEKGSLCWREAKAEFQKSSSINPDPRTLLFYFAHHFNNYNGTVSNSEGFELWRNITGGLVIPLMKAYETDVLAKKIVHQAIDCLVEQHYRAFKTSKLENFEPVTLFGGVFNHNQKFTDIFKIKLQEKYNKDIPFITRFSENTMRPVCGALLFSLSNSKTNSLKFPDDKLIELIYQNQKNSIYCDILINN